MKLASIDTIEHAADGTFLAKPLIEGDQAKVRIIRLAARQAFPPHRHGTSVLMLYVVAGRGELELATGTVPFATGQIAFFAGADELNVRNTEEAEMMLLAFLAPKFGTG